MTKADRVLKSTTLRREFLVTGDETDGRLVEMRVTYHARSPFPPPHLHPSQTETFVVEEGEMMVRLDGHESTLRCGNTLVVPPGSVHQMRNATGAPTIVNWKVEPALRTTEFFVASHAIEAGSLLDRALLLSSYRDVSPCDSTPAGDRRGSGRPRIRRPGVGAVAARTRSAGSLKGEIANPDGGDCGLHRLVHHLDQLVTEGVSFELIPKPTPETLHLEFRVITSPVEAAVHPPLHTSAQWRKHRRRSQSRSGDCHLRLG